MYKILGADGREYGPVSLDQLKQWVAQGRVNAQTRVQPADAEWKTAAELPELSGLFPAPAPRLAPPPSISPLGSAPQPKTGLAVTSLVLGILSLLCCLLVTGIPAIICGHIAYSRARRSPAQYGGSGMALAGLILGYFSLVLSLLVGVMVLPGLTKLKGRAQQLQCTMQLTQIGTAFKMWSTDHQEQYPFNVSTNNGGTLELCAPGPDGFDKNSAAHFQVMSNFLKMPMFLVCPADKSKRPALSWQNLRAANVTYQVRSGTNVDTSDPQTTVVVCPIHGTVLKADGSVESKSRSRRKP